MPISRRALLGSALLPFTPVRAAPPLAPPFAPPFAPVRVGTLRFGSVAWELDVVRTHALDAAEHVTIEPLEFAGAQATQVALQAGRVDMVLQDWLWVSRQRDSGADWTFAPSTASVGAVVTPEGSPIQTLQNLANRRLGIAGGPLDKSWLVLRAYASRVLSLDLDAQVEKTFGAPPLLAEQLRAGRIDAMLTYWPFVARAEAQGMRRLFAIEDAVSGLGISPQTPVLGWVFSEAWAKKPEAAVRPMLAAIQRARDILLQSDPEWDRIAPLTGAASPAELARLRDWYRHGIQGLSDRTASQDAAKLYDILAETGGPALVGDAKHLAPGTFWQTAPNPT